MTTLQAPSKLDPRGPVAAAVVVGGFLALTAASGPAKPGALFPWTVNPTGMLNEAKLYVLLYCLTIPAKEMMNVVMSTIGTVLLGFKRMDEGEGKVRKLEALETIDLCYLALNTVVEFIGMNHIAAFLAEGPTEYRAASIGILNGPVAFIVAMCWNDIIYYPFHLVAHRREFYAYCHKQHHRQFVPFRGYADAANQHPIEQFYGFSIFIVSLKLTAMTVGLHAATAWFAAVAWALLNIANHLAFNSNVHLPLPYPALPRDHQMHHRFPQCNYSTLTSFPDRFFGTFRSYRPLGQPIGDARPEDERPADGRPEAVPSWRSVAGLAVGLTLSATAVEGYHLGCMPGILDMLPLAGPLVVLVNLGFVCAAFESDPPSPVKLKESPEESRKDK